MSTCIVCGTASRKSAGKRHFFSAKRYMLPHLPPSARFKWTSSSVSKVCDLHFRTTDYTPWGVGFRLKSDAAPCQPVSSGLVNETNSSEKKPVPCGLVNKTNSSSEKKPVITLKVAEAVVLRTQQERELDMLRAEVVNLRALLLDDSPPVSPSTKRSKTEEDERAETQPTGVDVVNKAIVDSSGEVRKTINKSTEHSNKPNSSSVNLPREFRKLETKEKLMSVKYCIADIRLIEELLKKIPCRICKGSIVSTSRFFQGSALRVTVLCQENHTMEHWLQNKVGNKREGNVDAGASLFMSGNSFYKTKSWLNLAGIQFISTETYHKYNNNLSNECARTNSEETLQHYRLRLADPGNKCLDKNKEKTGRQASLAGDARSNSPGSNARLSTNSIADTTTRKGIISKSMETEQAAASTAAEATKKVIVSKSMEAKQAASSTATETTKKTIISKSMETKQAASSTAAETTKKAMISKSMETKQTASSTAAETTKKVIISKSMETKQAASSTAAEVGLRPHSDKTDLIRRIKPIILRKALKTPTHEQGNYKTLFPRKRQLQNPRPTNEATTNPPTHEQGNYKTLFPRARQIQNPRPTNEATTKAPTHEQGNYKTLFPRTRQLQNPRPTNEATTKPPTHEQGNYKTLFPRARQLQNPRPTNEATTKPPTHEQGNSKTHDPRTRQLQNPRPTNEATTKPLTHERGNYKRRFHEKDNKSIPNIPTKRQSLIIQTNNDRSIPKIVFKTLTDS